MNVAIRSSLHEHPWCCISAANMLFVHLLAGSAEVKKESLEAQVNRLAELIGRLESKV